MSSNPVLYYVHDPMCSWCWGFKPVLEQLQKKLQDKLQLTYILGGLAIDSESEMTQQMQSDIKSNWQRIQKTIPGTEFNYDFWDKNTPRRSTYPACRAVIAAGLEGDNNDLKMIDAIQQAYYLNAQNPSNYTVLYELARKLALDESQFKLNIHSENTQNELIKQIKFSRSIGADSFPSLFLSINKEYFPVVIDYNKTDIILEHLQVYL